MYIIKQNYNKFIITTTSIDFTMNEIRDKQIKNKIYKNNTLTDHIPTNTIIMEPVDVPTSKITDDVPNQQKNKLEQTNNRTCANTKTRYLKYDK